MSTSAAVLQRSANSCRWFLIVDLWAYSGNGGGVLCLLYSLPVRDGHRIFFYEFIKRPVLILKAIKSWNRYRDGKIQMVAAICPLSGLYHKMSVIKQTKVLNGLTICTV